MVEPSRSDPVTRLSNYVRMPARLAAAEQSSAIPYDLEHLAANAPGRRLKPSSALVTQLDLPAHPWASSFCVAVRISHREGTNRAK
jgi:hypothetical protein